MQMVIYAVILLLQCAVKKMVLQPTMLPVSVDQLTVLLLVLIAINLLIFVVLYHRAVKKMVLQPTMLPVSVDQLNVLLVPVSIVTNLSILAQLLVATSTVLLLIQNNAHVDQPGVQTSNIVLNLPIPAHHVLLLPVLVLIQME